MTAQSILKQLEALGNERTKALLMRNHQVQEPCYGVKIGDMKPIVRKIKKDYPLALELYATGNYDAMYLAGLIADDERMTKRDLQSWASKAVGGSLPGTTVPSVAAQGRYGWEMGLKWIDAKRPHVVIAGWATLGSVIALKADEELDLSLIRKLIKGLPNALKEAPDEVRYQMNMFLIAVGCYVKSLSKTAIEIGEKMGPMEVDLGNGCQVPYAPDYIRKVEKRGSLGKKRKTVKC